MEQFNRQKYFYFIALMLMASTFLKILFNNLPPIIRSHHLWTVIWVVSLLVFSPKIFFNKTILYILSYGLFLYLATQTIWSNIDEWNYKVLIIEFYQIFIGSSVITYFQKSNDYVSLAKISKWGIIFILITAVMTIISAVIDPMYARNLTAIASITDESVRETILSYKRYGGGTYSTASALMCLFPLIIYYYRNIKISLISRNQIIIFSIIIFLALLGMQIFGNIIIMIIFSTIALLGMKKMKHSILVIGIFFLIVLIIPRGVYVKTLLSVSEYFETESELNSKFKDMADFIDSGAKINDSNTGTSGRAARYPLLMKTFVKRPLFGCYFFSDEHGNGYNAAGAHLYWMNKLTINGIIGLIFFLIIPYFFVKNNLRYFDSTYKFYYVLASLAILSYGLIKVIVGREAWYTFFIILPGLYYLPLLKKSVKNK